MKAILFFPSFAKINAEPKHSKKFRLPIPISLHSGLNHNHLYKTLQESLAI